MKFSFKQILLSLFIAILILYPVSITNMELVEPPRVLNMDKSTTSPINQRLILWVEEDINHQPNLEDLAQVIKEYEGYYFNSVSDRNNNPGNLRYSPYQVGVRDGFAYFNTHEDGWNALLHQLTIAADGRSYVYDPEMNLYQFFNVYAPTEDSNMPNLYAKTVIEQLSISPETKLKEFIHSYRLSEK